MATSVTYQTIINYLTSIAEAANLGPNDPPHGRWWMRGGNALTYSDFISGTVRGVTCRSQPVPIIEQANPAQSPFYLILTQASGWCDIPQMPLGGPYITDDGYVVTLPNGSQVTGAQISRDMLEWLQNGYPENGN